MVLRKMLNNRWMVACLLFGTLMATGMVSSIPMYTEGVTRRMMRRDLQIAQETTGEFPGHVVVSFNMKKAAGGYDPMQYEEMYNTVNQEVNGVFSTITAPLLSSSHRAGFGSTFLNRFPWDGKKAREYTVESFSGLEDHVTLLDIKGPNGEVPRLPTAEIDRFPYEEPRTGEPPQWSRRFEAVITREMKEYKRVNVGDCFNVNGRYQILVVGIIDVNQTEDAYWYVKPDELNSSFILNYDALMAEFGYNLTFHQWVNSYDYQEMNLNSMPTLLSGIEQLQELNKGKRNMTLLAPAQAPLEEYLGRTGQLQLTLLVLEVPLMIMLAFYIFMVSQLIIDYEKNEISVLKSRGSNNAQILWMYLIQSLLLSGVAFVIGPFIGLFLCSIIGAADGFMVFVSRVGLPLSVSSPVFIYQLVALVFTIATMLLPAALQARSSIVEHKQRRSRRAKAPAWKRFGFDFVLIAAAIYGIFYYRGQSTALGEMTESSAAAMPIDPLLFIFSMFFILGFGLLCIRLYPLLTQLIFNLGKRKWKPVMYATFSQVSRSRGNEQYLMLFLVITISIGVFCANTARTINFNKEERVRYAVGADIVATPILDTRTEYVNALPSDFGPPDEFGNVSLLPGSTAKERQVYVEIPDSLTEGIEGVEGVTKVLHDKKGSWYQGSSSSPTPINGLIGIDPYSFGQVAYQPPVINGQYAWQHYLNAMNEAPYGAFLSKAFDNGKLKVGDTVRLAFGDNAPIEFTVLGFIDYWPTLSPNERVSIDDKGNETKEVPYFAVVSFAYCRSIQGVQPYEIWMKRAEGSTNTQVYESILAKGLLLDNMVDGRQEMATIKNDPMLQGTNGAMTLCFLMTLMVSIVGFIIYWVLSIRGRALQFGILRAMGLRMRDVWRMLLWEQLLISGLAVLLGLLVGTAASMLYVPLLEIIYTLVNQPPAFRVVSSNADYYKLYGFIAVMLAAGCGLVVYLVGRIKVTQAIKLGED